MNNKEATDKAIVFFLPLVSRNKNFKPLDPKKFKKFWHTGIIYKDKVYETFSNSKFNISSNDRVKELKRLNAIFIEHDIIVSKLKSELKSGISCDNYVLRVLGFSDCSGSDKGDHYPDDVYALLIKK